MYQIHPTIAATLVSQRRDAFEAHAATARLARPVQPTWRISELRTRLFGVRRVTRHRRPALV